MAKTKTITGSTAPKLPDSLLPSWYGELKAKSLNEGLAKYRRYLKNAKDNAVKAQVHPIDTNRFLDTEYSSAAGQSGYMAAMILVDGFVASFVSYKPARLLVATPNQAITNLVNHGLNGRYAYKGILDELFGKSIGNQFDLIYLSLHIDVHYRLNDNISQFQFGISTVEKFQKNFKQLAQKTLAKHNIPTN